MVNFGTDSYLDNIENIAHSLGIQSQYIVKYFGYELGAQCTEKGQDRKCVNGNHTVEILEGLIEKFIKDFIICPACSLPECSMAIKNTHISLQCKACGKHSRIQKAHKIISYILTHSPEVA